MQQAVKYKILNIINELELNLKDKIILTEAATGAYVVTPIIAALAGAKVIALTRNTKYGTVEEVKNQTNTIVQLFHENLDIQIVEELTSEILKDVDIITNSGHLRPLNSNILQHVKKGAVISYMYEAWEYREGDLDLEYCSKNDIKVVATNEKHPNIDVFNYLGELAVRLIHDAGKCLYKNKFIIISNNDFGYHIANTVIKLCDKIGVIDIEENKNKYPQNIDWIGNFPEIEIPESYKDTEAIIFTAYPFENTWIKEDGELKINSIKNLSNPIILRFAGHLDTQYLDKNNIEYYPKEVKAGHMGVLLSEIGNDSVIRLQAGGLKVAEMAISKQSIFNNNKILEYL